MNIMFLITLVLACIIFLAYYLEGKARKKRQQERERNARYFLKLKNHKNR